jgi:hypothetical protein
MTDTLKTLSQTYPAANTLTTAYTVPGATSAVVASVIACNRGTGNATIRVSVAIAGAADEEKQYLYYDLPILAKDTFVATLGLSLATTDVVRVYSDSGMVAFTLTGVEVT